MTPQCCIECNQQPGTVWLGIRLLCEDCLAVQRGGVRKHLLVGKYPKREDGNTVAMDADDPRWNSRDWRAKYERLQDAADAVLFFADTNEMGAALNELRAVLAETDETTELAG